MSPVAQIKQEVQAALEKAGLPAEEIAKIKQATIDNGLSFTYNILKLNMMTPEQLCENLGAYYKKPFIPIPADAKKNANLVPRNLVSRYGVVPISIDGKMLTLGMLNPKDLEAADSVSFLTGYEIIPVGVLETDFEKFVEETAPGSGIAGVIEGVDATEVSEMNDGENEAEAQTRLTLSNASDSTIQKFIMSMAADAITNRVSDIHLEPQEKVLLLRYRVDGMLRTVFRLPLNVHPQLVSALKIMAQLDITETRRPQDGRISMRVADRNIDLRLGTIMTHYGENIVMRVLDAKAAKTGMNDLGMPDYVHAQLKELGLQNTGMLLVTGPTGSGKTTTLYAFIQMIRTPNAKILTLEDPIEYPILEGDKAQEGGITQIQINSKINMNFATGLRAALRLDPDIIFVGEIRDRETAEISFSAALTGRLVLSTLHTNDAPSTITRLLDMQIDPFLLAAALKGVLSQRLVRRLCTECRVRYEPPPKTLERLAKTLPRETVMSIVPTLYRPRGCKICGGRGYMGRIGLYELLEISDDLRNLILTRAPISELSRAAQSSGLRTLRMAGLVEVLKGRTTLAEVFRVTPNE
jgi:type II secretory ATPase GspE/PulE/Tfp pilus assembly ATPase PilB-like protein